MLISIVFLVTLSSEAYLIQWSLSSLYIQKNIQNRKRFQNVPLAAKSKMPIFNEEDEEELANIMTNQRKPTPNPVRPKIVEIPQTVPSPTVVTRPLKASKSPDSNSEWAVAKSDFNPYVGSQYNAKKPPVVADDEDEYFAFTDLDYADFEAAMREEETASTAVKSEKRTAAPVVEYVGLSSGDLLPPPVWSSLKLVNDTQCNYNSLLRPNSDLMVLYSDPRRMTDETRAVLRQLANVPHQSLGLSMVAVNCDDSVDLRKFLKKANYPTSGITMLADTSKKVYLFNRIL